MADDFYLKSCQIVLAENSASISMNNNGNWEIHFHQDFHKEHWCSVT